MSDNRGGRKFLSENKSSGAGKLKLSQPNQIFFIDFKCHERTEQADQAAAVLLYGKSSQLKQFDGKDTRANGHLKFRPDVLNRKMMG